MAPSVALKLTLMAWDRKDDAKRLPEGPDSARTSSFSMLAERSWFKIAKPQPLESSETLEVGI